MSDLKNQRRTKDKYSLDVLLTDMITGAVIMKRTNAPARDTLRKLNETLEAKD